MRDVMQNHELVESALFMDILEVRSHMRAFAGDAWALDALRKDRSLLDKTISEIEKTI